MIEFVQRVCNIGGISAKKKTSKERMYACYNKYMYIVGTISQLILSSCKQILDFKREQLPILDFLYMVLKIETQRYD